MDAVALDAELSMLADARSFSGVVRVDGPGGPWFAQAYGLASPTWGVPCTLHTRFDTASITKLFTAVATLQQIEAGAFALDTSVIDYLGLSGTQISPDVTPYHLLTHTSGIGDDADEEAGERYEDLWVDTPNYSVTETEQILANFVNRAPNFAPGEGCRYCNGSYVLLGLMVERATGQSYRDYVTERVFAAAGMTAPASSGWTSSRPTWPRASIRSSTPTATSPDGVATSTRTRRSVRPTAAPTSRPTT